MFLWISNGRYQHQTNKHAEVKRYPFDSGHTVLYPSRDITFYVRMMTSCDTYGDIEDVWMKVANIWNKDFAYIRAKTQEIKDTQQAEPIQEFAENAEHSI
ncbi:unnamed protein product [Clonostachys rosea f. rosea IK726]|uniref:Uncharacterized protein n=1 Tax=Clonostachys rosea f. rosea IK726 TaxID=1349383 RepID=A0ACA9TRP8_BIOOC|nr:unnamed protein product [Clonostachys rosea f. rosea IK726]